MDGQQNKTMLTFQNLYLGEKDQKATTKPVPTAVAKRWNSGSLFPYVFAVSQLSEGRGEDPKILQRKKQLPGPVFSRLRGRRVRARGQEREWLSRQVMQEKEEVETTAEPRSTPQ